MRVLAIGWLPGCRLRGNRHNRGPQFGVRRQHPMKADQMQARARHEGGEPLHEFQRRHDEVARAVAIRGLRLEHHLPGAVHAEPLVGGGRAGDVAAPLLKVAALIGGAAHPRSIDAIQLAHALGEIGIRRLDQHMIVVGHLAIGMAHPVEPLANFGERFKPRDTIFVGKEYVLAPVPARSDVVERAGEFES